MRKFIFAIFLVVLTGVLLAGCSKNPMGSYGPAWDVGIKLPLAQNKVETIDEIFADNQDIIVNSENPEGEDSNLDPDQYILLQEINDTDIHELVNIGSTITDITNLGLPTISETINLQPISVDNISGDINKNGITIYGGLQGGSKDLAQLNDIQITFDNFTDISFSSNSINEMNIILDYSSSDNLSIDDLTLSFEDSNGNSLGAPVNFGSVASGDHLERNWDIGGINLTQTVYAVITIDTTSGVGTEQGNIDITFSFPTTVEISAVTGLDTTSVPINETIIGSITTDTGNFDQGLKELGFSAGNLNINIDSAPTGLNYNWNSLTIGGVPYDNLSGHALNLATGQLVIDYSLQVTNSGNTLDYNSEDSISISASFAPTTTIDYITADLSAGINSLSDIYETLGPVTVIENLDLPEDISKVELSEYASVLLNFISVANLDLNLSNIKLKALDSSGNQVRQDGNNLEFDLGQISGSQDIDLLNKDTGFDLYDLFTNPGTDSIVIDGYIDGSRGDISSSGDVTIKNNTQIGINGMNAYIPLQLHFKEPVEETMEVEAVESLDSEQVEMINKGLKDARLIITGINSDFPVSVNVDFYLASIPGGDNKSPEELESILYGDEANIFESFIIESNVSGGSQELIISQEKAEKLTEPDLYFGAKITIPENSEGEYYSFKSGASLELGQVYSAFNVKVNQLND